MPSGRRRGIAILGAIPAEPGQGGVLRPHNAYHASPILPAFVRFYRDMALATGGPSIGMGTGAA